jgi:hypothetical protein
MIQKTAQPYGKLYNWYAMGITTEERQATLDEELANKKTITQPAGTFLVMRNGRHNRF